MGNELTKSATYDSQVLVGVKKMTIYVVSHAPIDMAFLGEEIEKKDGILDITIHIGEFGQNLRVVKNDEITEDKFGSVTVDNRPGA